MSGRSRVKVERDLIAALVSAIERWHGLMRDDHALCKAADAALPALRAYLAQSGAPACIYRTGCTTPAYCGAAQRCTAKDAAVGQCSVTELAETLTGAMRASDAQAGTIARRDVPLPMVLHCPHCHAQHVDAAEPDTGWTNPPHKSHLCHACGAIWRPADVPTTGVRAIETQGAHDRPPARCRHVNWKDGPQCPDCYARDEPPIYSADARARGRE